MIFIKIFKLIPYPLTKEFRVTLSRGRKEINIGKCGKIMHTWVVKRINSIINTEEKKRLVENFFSLFILQGTNYILPLITLPYLVRVLGPEKFGLIAFAQVFIRYFNILTDYGFNLSATREISIYRDNKEKVSEIFNSVMIIKLGLLTLSFVIMTIIVLLFNKFRKEWLIYYSTFGTVIGQVLFPVWFFQGMEKMKYITFLNIISKLIFTIFIFIFVHKVSDYIYVPFLSSLGFLIAGIWALRIVLDSFGIVLKIPHFVAIEHQLKEGWYVFISTIAISLYTISNTFILGLFTNNAIVGYYSSAEKIIKAIQGLLTPIFQAVYPYVNRVIKESKDKGVKFIQKITFLVGGVSFIASLIIFIFADFIVKFLLGSQYLESIVVLRILAFLPFIIALSNIFGIQTMLTFNFKKDFLKILINASIINISLALILVPIYKHIGVSFSVLISEVFVTISMFVFLQKKGINILEGKIV